MLGPLVEAYQETIREKDLALQTTQREAAAYESKCKELVADTEALRAQLTLSRQEVPVQLIFHTTGYPNVSRKVILEACIYAEFL